MNRDFVEMLSELCEAGAEFLIVGAHALAAHGPPRYTGDLDIWLRPSPENARRVFKALEAFGAPRLDFIVEDLARPRMVFQIGVPPVRIDLLTSISGVDFETAWSRRFPLTVGGLEVFTISRDDFVANKRAAGRPKDLLDIALLEEFEAERGKADK
jgi:hypothetical protein